MFWGFWFGVHVTKNSMWPASSGDFLKLSINGLAVPKIDRRKIKRQSYSFGQFFFGTGDAGSDGPFGGWELENEVWKSKRRWLFAAARALGSAWDSGPNHDETTNSLVCALRICKRDIPGSWISFDSELGCLPICLAGMPPCWSDGLLCQEIPHLVYQRTQFNTGWPVSDWPSAA